MQIILSDIVRMTAPLFPKIKVTGTAVETKIQAVDDDKRLFLQATLKEPQPELVGEFGITNLPLLMGLLGFASYRAEGADFSVGRKVLSGSETVHEFRFSDPQGSGAVFKTADPKAVGEQAEIARIAWDITLVPSKAKVAEFAQLASLYSKVDNHFGIATSDGKLVFNIGAVNDSTHTASVVFASDVTGSVRAEMDHQTFSMARFLAILRMAGDAPTTVNITSKGILGITIETEFGTYNYYMRAKR